MQFNEQNPLRVFEAFAGYGSQSMALQRLHNDYGLPFKVVGISEVDPNAINAYYACHDSAIPNYGDICHINWGGVDDFDLFTYSFPCTNISAAGHQQGLTEGSGTASSLLWECRKAIAAKRPKYLLMENVKALLQKKFSEQFGKWLTELSDLGYTNFFSVLNAKDFGVAQNRERVFMVSILDCESDYVFPNGFTLDKRVEDYLQDEEEVGDEFHIDSARVTPSVVKEIFSQKYVFEQLCEIYHQEWKEANSD